MTDDQPRKAPPLPQVQQHSQTADQPPVRYHHHDNAATIVTQQPNTETGNHVGACLPEPTN